MNHEQDGRQPAAVDEAAAIICILTGCVLILGLPAWLGQTDVSWQRFLFTNSWMLGAILLWTWRYPLHPVGWRAPETGLGLPIGVACLAAVAILGTKTSPGARLPLGVSTPFDYVAFTAVGPITEELFYRGLLFNFLIRRLGSNRLATTLATTLFVMMHFPGKQESIVLALVSIVLCLVALRTRTLIWPILLHAGWNLCVLGWSGPRGQPRHIVVLFVALGLLAATWMLKRPRRSASSTTPPRS